MQSIITDPVTFPDTPEIDTRLLNFLAACLEKDPGRRPTSPLKDLRRLRSELDAATAGFSAIEVDRTVLIRPQRNVDSVWQDEEWLPTLSDTPLAANPNPNRRAPGASQSHRARPTARATVYGLALAAGVTALAGGVILAVALRASIDAQVVIGSALIAAGILLSLAVRRWLRRQRAGISAEAGRVLKSTRSRQALTHSLAIQVDHLMDRCQSVQEQFLGASIAIMIDEFQQAKEFNDRHRALAASIDFLEKLMKQQTPWYVRYEKVITAAVGLLGVVPGVYQILETLSRR
jgi:hypothetical protein